MSGEEQLDYLQGINGSFFGRDGLERGLVTKGFLREDFIEDYWPVYRELEKAVRSEGDPEDRISG